MRRTGVREASFVDSQLSETSTQESMWCEVGRRLYVTRAAAVIRVALQNFGFKV